MKRLAMLALALGACTSKQDPPPLTSVSADSADMILGTMATRITAAGVLVSDITADSAWYYQTSQRFDLKVQRVVFADSLGHIESTITSKRGNIRTTKAQVLDAWDSVVAVTPRGDTLRTSHLLWDKLSNLITSDSAFTFKSPDKDHPGGFTTLRGNSFVATPDFKSVQIQKAKGRQVAPGKPAVKKAPPVKRKPAG